MHHKLKSEPLLGGRNKRKVYTFQQSVPEPLKAAAQSKGSHLGGNVVQCSAIEQDPKGDNDSIAVAGAGTWHQGHRAGATAILQVGGVLPTHAAQLRTLYTPKCGFESCFYS